MGETEVRRFGGAASWVRVNQHGPWRVYQPGGRLWHRPGMDCGCGGPPIGLRGVQPESISPIDKACVSIASWNETQANQNEC